MPDVDAIIERLRAGSDDLEGWGMAYGDDCPRLVLLADAEVAVEAAVVAAVDARTAEIVEALRRSAGLTADENAAILRRQAADMVEDAYARRFPNGGTNDGE